MRKLRFGDRIEVCWEDASSRGGWTAAEALKELPASCISIGYLVKRDRSGVWLAGSLHTKELAAGECSEVGEASFIPAGGIKRIRQLR